MGYDCPRCDYSTDSKAGFGIHVSKTHDSHWLVELEGEDKLRELYEEKSRKQMARDYDVTIKVITKALTQIGVKFRDASEAASHYIERNGKQPHHFEAHPPYLTHHTQGYEEIRHAQKRVYVHRLAAVAWFGFDAVDGNHVHHRNNVPWDNREDNLAVLSESAHRSHHMQEMLENGTGIAERYSD